MYILITKTEFLNHSALATMITNQQAVSINDNEGVMGEITAANFTQISPSLATASYSASDGILIPAGMLGS